MDDGTDDIFTHADLSMKITIHLPDWPWALFSLNLLHQQHPHTKKKKIQKKKRKRKAHLGKHFRICVQRSDRTSRKKKRLQKGCFPSGCSFSTAKPVLLQSLGTELTHHPHPRWWIPIFGTHIRLSAGTRLNLPPIRSCTLPVCTPSPLLCANTTFPDLAGKQWKCHTE